MTIIGSFHVKISALFVRATMLQDGAASAAEHPANIPVEGQGAWQRHAVAHLD